MKSATPSKAGTPSVPLEQFSSSFYAFSVDSLLTLISTIVLIGYVVEFIPHSSRTKQFIKGSRFPESRLKLYRYVHLKIG